MVRIENLSSVKLNYTVYRGLYCKFILDTGVYTVYQLGEVNSILCVCVCILVQLQLFFILFLVILSIFMQLFLTNRLLVV